MNVYNVDRIAPAAAPPEFADDVQDLHFVPAPCQVACPIGTDAPSYIAYIWEGKLAEVIVGTIPFHLTMFVVLALVILWPDLALWLPHHVSR